VILSNIEIQRALDEGRLVIDPEPLPRRPRAGEYCPYDTHAVDLRLFHEITVPQPGPDHFDVTERGTLPELIAGRSQRYVLSDEKPYPLQPHQFILGRTLERVELPVDKGTPHLAARIEGKSSRARCGLMVHFTARHAHRPAHHRGGSRRDLPEPQPVPRPIHAGRPGIDAILAVRLSLSRSPPGQP
jgi:dCTP deaminase